MDDLRRALHLTHTFWGGRFNPIIPVGNTDEAVQVARSLVDVFHVDVLHAVANVPSINAFIESFPYLPWPKFDRGLFVDSMRGKIATFIDVYHPLAALFEEHIKDKAEPRVTGTLFEWNEADPLKDVFLASFGAYPTRDEIGKDYSDFFATNLKAKRVPLNVADAVPADSYKALTPSALSAVNLNSYGRSARDNPGLFVGDPADYDDIVSFWNLRAADIDLVFYAPTQAARLGGVKAAYLEALRKRPADPVGWRDRISIWAKSIEVLQQNNFGENTVGSVVTPTIWNGLNVVPPYMYIGDEQVVLASVTESATPLSYSFQLPEKPFSDDAVFHSQDMVVSVRPLVDISRTEESTIRPPYIPELNEYYGRNAHFMWNEVRSERGGLGIIANVTRNDLTIRALPSRGLVARIFEAFGMKAESSTPGLIASRLIRQMGGLQGCRVFKITGVRKLIEKYGPLESFTRSCAVQMIGQNDPGTGRPNFDQFEGLFIEQREESKLKPEHAFIYLVKNGVFRAGLNLKCPNCELDFWVALDDVATEVQCELCGSVFNITSQLRDRDWAYRRSGLFGRQDHQEGSIPVALTLQQIDTMFTGDSIYSTAMKLSPVTANIEACETDFVIIGKHGWEGRVSLAIGECKTKDKITEQDVAHLKKVADAFPSKRIAPYIIFSKTAPFTAEEIQRCRAAQDPYRLRVILLSDRELEPYFVYERAEKEFEIRSAAISLEDLANVTQHIYFEPKPKRHNPAGAVPQ
jgi:ribosomal protein S27E